MKKRTLLAFVVAMSVTAIAAANPFSDVPAKHWAYDSVMKLEKAGIVEGFGDGTFRGEKNMTRYEMAQIIARAMARVDKADAALKAELDKLSVEFAQELKNLGVRVAALENQTQNVKFSGDMRLRYIHGEDGAFDNKNVQDARFRLEAEGKVNENWSVVGRFEVNDDFRQKDGGTSEVILDKMFVQGKIGDFGTRVGRIDVFSAYGLVFDDYMDGLEISYEKNNWYVIGRYGRIDNVDGSTAGDWARISSNTQYQIEAGTSIGSKVNVKAAYWHFDNDANMKNFGIWEVGADATLGRDFKVTASAANQISGDDFVGANGKKMDSIAWFAQLDYKGADKEVTNSWGLFGGYRDFSSSIAPVITTFNTVGKGWYVGGTYVPAKNVVISAWYENMKNTSIGINESKDYVRAEVEFFF